MGDKTWTFRGDSELDPILKKWSKRFEKSFHIRQALRLYTNGSNFIQANYAHELYVGEDAKEAEVSFDEWG